MGIKARGLLGVEKNVKIILRGEILNQIKGLDISELSQNKENFGWNNFFPRRWEGNHDHVKENHGSLWESLQENKNELEGNSKPLVVDQNGGFGEKDL